MIKEVLVNINLGVKLFSLKGVLLGDTEASLDGAPLLRALDLAKRLIKGSSRGGDMLLLNYMLLLMLFDCMLCTLGGVYRD